MKINITLGGQGVEEEDMFTTFSGFLPYLEAEHSTASYMWL